MASISRDKRGRCTVQFIDRNGKRRTIGLGKIPERSADRIKDKVEALNHTAKAGLAPDEDTAAWLRRMGDKLHAQLVAAGLTQPREPAEPAPCPTLAEFLDQYRADRGDVGEKTQTSYGVIGKRLLAFFGADERLDAINPGRAEDFATRLRTPGASGERSYAPATAAKTIKMARQMFRRAVRLRIIAENPFEDIKAGSEKNRERNFYVTPETTRKVIDACPDAEWRLLVALTRYGGLRNPSETLELTWPDILWDQDRFRVHSPKTRKQGKGERIVPLFPELRPYLEDAFELAEPGAVHIITRYRDSNANLRTEFLRIIRKAGVEPWERLFQNLRASRETELSERFPLRVVTDWLGNSPNVAHDHYLSTTEDHYKRASAALGSAERCTEREPQQYGIPPDELALQKALHSALQNGLARVRTDSQTLMDEGDDGEADPSEPLAECDLVPTGANAGELVLSEIERVVVVPGGLEPPLFPMSRGCPGR